MGVMGASGVGLNLGSANNKLCVFGKGNFSVMWFFHFKKIYFL